MDPLRRLIDAVPRATLAEIIFEMLAAEPASRSSSSRSSASSPRGLGTLGAGHHARLGRRASQTDLS